MEADPRHAEILGAMLGSDRRVVSTPGVKERVEAPRGQCRPAQEEEAGAYEARTSARTAKVRELQQQIRDLAAQLAAGSRQLEARRAGDVESQQGPALTAVAAPGRARGVEDHDGPQEEEADRVLTEVEAGWFRGAAARAN